MEKEQITKIAKVIKTEVVKDLVDDLGWEFDRMSESGQESYKKLCKLMGWTFDC